MKRIRVSFKLWYAGYRAHPGIWWLMTVTLIACFAFFLYAFLTPHVEARSSISENLSHMHTEIRFSGDKKTEAELNAVFTLLKETACVDYYILEKRLGTPAEGTLSTVSTVVSTRTSLYAWQDHDALCQSEWGEPLNGCAYINTRYIFEGALPLNLHDSFEMDGFTATYTANIWGDNLFDILLSEGDFEQIDRPIVRILYGISSFASRADVNALNEQIAVLLPRTHFFVVMEKDLGVNSWGNFINMLEPDFIGIVLSGLLAWFLLYQYQMELRGRELMTARLVGCRRWELYLLMIGEAMWNSLLAFFLAMAGYTLYRWLFITETWRVAFLLWKDALPLLVALVVVGSVLGAFLAYHCVRHSMTDVGKGG